MALIYPQNSDLKKLLKSSLKKVPQSARLSAGGGVQKLKGQCPNAPGMKLGKASLTFDPETSSDISPKGKEQELTELLQLSAPKVYIQRDLDIPFEYLLLDLIVDLIMDLIPNRIQDLIPAVFLDPIL